MMLLTSLHGVVCWYVAFGTGQLCSISASLSLAVPSSSTAPIWITQADLREKQAKPIYQ